MIDSSLQEVARGEAPADLLLRGGRVVNVLSGELEDVDVAVWRRRVAGLGPGYEASRVVDLDGSFLLPGLIDAHVHVESSLATPREFARAIVPRGTTTVVSDPHEIANVHGLEGIRYMLEASEGLPLSVFVMAPSCVPATSMGTAGAELDAESLATLLGHPRVIGLAEVMNFPGVIHGDPSVAAKLRAFSGRIVDGHAPAVRGRDLNAYVAGGPGSDHESTSPEEALEKLRRGMMVFLREATNARNLRDLIPMLTSENLRRVALCTDDRQPPDLLDSGGIDEMLRIVMATGIPPVEAIRMATLNPAEYFGLRDRGAIAPGRRADMVVVENLERVSVSAVYSGGVQVARDGRPLSWELPPPPAPPPPSMHIDWNTVDLRLPAREGQVRVIRVIPHQLLTETLILNPTVREDRVISDVERDLLKITVIDRHTPRPQAAVGLVNGMGFRSGAIAGTVAHDHHNLIAVGVEDEAILRAGRAVAEMGGGLAVATREEVLASLPLPVGGLMSTESIHDVRAGLDRVLGAARTLGSKLHDPFMAMSFLGLEVIPSLKITDQGLVDVDRFRPVPFWI